MPIAVGLPISAPLLSLPADAAAVASGEASVLSFGGLLADRGSLAETSAAPLALPFLTFDLSVRPVALAHDDVEPGLRIPERREPRPRKPHLDEPAVAQPLTASAMVPALNVSQPTEAMAVISRAMLDPPGALPPSERAVEPAKGADRSTIDRSATTVRHPAVPDLVRSAGATPRDHGSRRASVSATFENPAAVSTLTGVDERRNGEPAPSPRSMDPGAARQPVANRDGTDARTSPHGHLALVPGEPGFAKPLAARAGMAVAGIAAAASAKAVSPPPPPNTGVTGRQAPLLSASAVARAEMLEERQLPIHVTLHPAEHEIALTARIVGSTGDAAELARVAQRLVERSGFQLSGLVLNGRRMIRQSRR